jgi:predicted phage tail protein
MPSKSKLKSQEDLAKILRKCNKEVLRQRELIRNLQHQLESTQRKMKMIKYSKRGTEHMLRKQATLKAQNKRLEAIVAAKE